jgi:hypothetical protein
MEPTEDEDNNSENNEKDASQGHVVIDLIDQTRLECMLTAERELLAGLDEAARMYQLKRVTDLTGRNAGPPKLYAAVWAVRNFVGWLRIVDQGEGNDRRRQPVMELLKALDDLRKGRERPDWIKGHKLTDHGVDAAVVWGARSLVAGVLQRMIDAKVPRATELVWEVARQHGLLKRTDKVGAVYGWLRRCREGKPGPALGVLVQSYHEVLRTFRAVPECTEAERGHLKKELLAFLSRELTHRGFPPSVDAKISG